MADWLHVPEQELIDFSHKWSWLKVYKQSEAYSTIPPKKTTTLNKYSYHLIYSHFDNLAVDPYILLL
jgi:hypothetical protein